MKAKLETSFKFTDEWGAEGKAAIFIQLLLNVPCPHDPNDTYIQGYSYSFFVPSDFPDIWVNETRKWDEDKQEWDWKPSEDGMWLNLTREFDLKWHDPLGWFWEVVSLYLDAKI